MAKETLVTFETAAELLGVNKLVEQGKIKDAAGFLRRMGQRAEIEVRRVGRFPMVVESSINRILEGKA